MEAREITDTLFSIKENLKRAKSLNNGLFIKRSREEWLAYFYGKRNDLEEIYKKNTKDADEIRNLLLSPLTDDTADALYKGVSEFWDDDIPDMSLSFEIMDKLIPYYEAKKDYPKMLRLYTEKGYNSESFMHLSKEYINKYFRESIEEILSLTEKYDKFPCFPDRHRLLIAYYNAISLLPKMGPDSLDRLIPLYKKAKEFLLGDMVKEMGDTDYGISEFNLIKTLFIENYVYYLTDGISSQMEFVDILDEIKNTFPTEKECDFANAILSYFHDQMNDSELAEYLRKYFTEFYKAAMKLDLSGYMTDEDIIACDHMFQTSFMIYEFLKNSFLSQNELKEYSLYLNECLFSFLDKITAENTNEYFEEMTAEVIRYAFPYMDGANNKIELLIRYIIRVQPHAYITALLNEQIGLAIYDSMEETGSLPKGMVNLGLTKEEMRMYLSECFRIHDLGSCLNVGIVSSEPRKISKTEYFYVRLHPGKSSMILGDDKEFAPYRDIIIGHHKSYDGKSGYPLEFDNTKSEFRDIIDLVSIVDSIEAGCDHYGRIYQKNKTFDEVLNELVSESGTRYNPYITGYIKGNRELRDKLSYLCEEGRIKMVYEVTQNGK